MNNKIKALKALIKHLSKLQYDDKKLYRAYNNSSIKELELKTQAIAIVNKTAKRLEQRAILINLAEVILLKLMDKPVPSNKFGKLLVKDTKKRFAKYNDEGQFWFGEHAYSGAAHSSYFRAISEGLCGNLTIIEQDLFNNLFKNLPVFTELELVKILNLTEPKTVYRPFEGSTTLPATIQASTVYNIPGVLGQSYYASLTCTGFVPEPKCKYYCSTEEAVTTQINRLQESLQGLIATYQQRIDQWKTCQIENKFQQLPQVRR